ncbi:acetate--CoA ligase family protein [Bradyrhizobium sp. CCGB12]|uniref:acetate--CoA ligase family protein n=1 Tax=Bradyrhizobium sp. CCGB12 TaxID=2949632 RepID=UPI0020B3AAD0|nr:acetate--CoA ligase family protein [Bradyrhizobium sp. CCGB12]MCP3392270.1 acetate--CoA ligase family protein [Bradyrhizobium sp. CCGB12]
MRDAKNEILTECEGKRLLDLYGIPVAREALATRADESAFVAQQLGLPVAMKIVSPTNAHKTDVGGVVLNVSSSNEVAELFDSIMASVRLRCPEAELARVLVQQMAKSARDDARGHFRSSIRPSYRLWLGWDLGRGSEGYPSIAAALR